MGVAVRPGMPSARRSGATVSSVSYIGQYILFIMNIIRNNINYVYRHYDWYQLLIISLVSVDLYCLDVLLNLKSLILHDSYNASSGIKIY